MPAKSSTKQNTGNKTKQTEASVESYFASLKDESRRKECEALASLMSKATGQPPKMWGSAIVGFGSYHYKYESGREGDTCTVGFASRANEIVLYGLGQALEETGLLPSLGKCKTGKGCLYVQKLADIDPKALQRLVADAYAERSGIA